MIRHSWPDANAHRIPEASAIISRINMAKKVFPEGRIAGYSGRRTLAPGFAGAFAVGKQPRVAYGGIGIESGTYSRIRTRTEDFMVLKGKELTDSNVLPF